MAFWTSSNVNPKLKSRFIVEIGGVKLLNVKSVTKPSFTIETKTYTLINHKFKYPGLANWEPITITFVDAFDSEQNGLMSTEQLLDQMINDTGYLTPDKQTHKLGTRTKDTTISSPSKASNAENTFYSSFNNQSSGRSLGGVIQIKHLDASGAIRDTWSLHGPVLKSVKFGDLSYESDDLVEYTIDVEYDYAIYGLGDQPMHQDNQ